MLWEQSDSGKVGKGLHGMMSAIVGTRPNKYIYAMVNTLKTARHTATKGAAKTHRGNFCVCSIKVLK